MNKIHIVSAIILASIVSVNAQTGTAPKGMMRGAPLAGQGGVGAVSVGSTTRPMMVSGQQKLTYPTTGDAKIDAQIKTLTEEKDAKIRLILEDYSKNLRTLIGNRPVNSPSMRVNASGTPLRAQGNGPMASGTRVQPNIQGVTQRAVNQGVKPVEERGIGAQLGNFFRGIFGGNR